MRRSIATAFSVSFKMFAMWGWGIDTPAWCLCRRLQLAVTASDRWQMDQTAVREGFPLVTNLTNNHANCTGLTLHSWSTGVVDLRKDSNSKEEELRLFFLVLFCLFVKRTHEKTKTEINRCDFKWCQCVQNLIYLIIPQCHGAPVFCYTKLLMSNTRTLKHHFLSQSWTVSYHNTVIHYHGLTVHLHFEKVKQFL